MSHIFLVWKFVLDLIIPTGFILQNLNRVYGGKRNNVNIAHYSLFSFLFFFFGGGGDGGGGVNTENKILKKFPGSYPDNKMVGGWCLNLEQFSIIKYELYIFILLI